MTNNHSLFSPSSAHRWLKCTASIYLENRLKLPDWVDSEIPKITYEHFKEESKYANEGNVKHNEAARLLLDNTNKLSEDDAVNEYLQYCRRLITIANNNLWFVEKQVAFNSIIEDGFGTVDFFIINNDTLEIVDFKYGRRRVLAEENPQLMLYAYGVLETFIKETNHIKSIMLTICQPRALDLGPSIDTYFISRRDIIKFAYKISEIFDNLKRTFKYNASDHCYFCNAKLYCPELKNKYIQIQNDIDDKTIYDNNEISKILDLSNSIKRFLQEIENLAIRKISCGENIPFYKIKDDPGRSYWRDGIENELIKLLGEKAYNKNIIPITQAKKYLGKNTVEKLTYKRHFGPKIEKTKNEINESQNIGDMFDD